MKELSRTCSSPSWHICVCINICASSRFLDHTTQYIFYTTLAATERKFLFLLTIKLSFSSSKPWVQLSLYCDYFMWIPRSRPIFDSESDFVTSLHQWKMNKLHIKIYSLKHLIYVLCVCELITLWGWSKKRFYRVLYCWIKKKINLLFYCWRSQNLNSGIRATKRLVHNFILVHFFYSIAYFSSWYRILFNM